jgi:hypothetical protein
MIHAPSKAEKFKTLAEARTGKAMNAIATLRGLANSNNYDYTPDQAAKIVSALRSEVDVIEKAFAGTAPKAQGFSL